MIEKLSHIESELKTLMSVVMYGESRLKALPKQILTIKQQLSDRIDSKEALCHILGELEQYQALLQASCKAIDEWQDKLIQYSHLIREIEQDGNIEQSNSCQSLKATVNNLTELMTNQSTFLKQEQEKTAQYSKQAQKKLKSCTTFYERGKAPLLNDEAADWEEAFLR